MQVAFKASKRPAAIKLFKYSLDAFFWLSARQTGASQALFVVLFPIGLACSCLLQGCAPSREPPLVLPPPLISDKTAARQTLGKEQTVQDTHDRHAPLSSQGRVRFTSVPPLQSTGADAGMALPEKKLALPANASATVNIHDMPIPAFINELYGNILQIPFQLDPEISKLTDLVTLRTIEAQSGQTLYDLGKQVLERYGIGMEAGGEVLYFAPAKNLGAEAPLIVSGRSLPDVPVTHRPIFMLAPLHVVKAEEITTWLNQAFAGQNLKIQGDSGRNSIMLQGQPDLVNQAIQAIAILDQPFMRGRYGLRINSEYFSAAELSEQLTQVLQAEGYDVSSTPTTGSSTLLIPIENARAVLAFASSQEVLDHIKHWVLSLDVPGANTSSRQSIFFYDVQNTSVTSLAATLNAILEGEENSDAGITTVSSMIKANDQTGQAPNRMDRGSVTPGASSAPANAAVVADELRNSLVFRGSSEQWNELLQVIHRFDRPSKQVLIEVTIAEITLSDSLEKGVEWQVYVNQNKQIPKSRASAEENAPGTGSGSTDSPAQGRLAEDRPNAAGALKQQTGAALLNPYTLFSFGTLNGLGLPKNGFTFTLESAGHTKALLNAFARDNRINIISTPRVLVKSGMEAKIEVGTDVPTVTASQSSSGLFDTGANTGLIQSIEYRKTGVLLGVKPIVYSGNRVDLQVSQEISDISSQNVTNISSPSILARKIETDVTLTDGGSVLLGGLISTTTTEETRGIPLLKDIPLLGQLFRTDARSSNRSMVVMLIVPYIIEDQEDAAAITEALKRRLNIRTEEPVDRGKSR